MMRISEETVNQWQEDDSGQQDGIDIVKAYHHRSKHHFSAYARGPETLDWECQPNPFRRIENTVTIKLPMIHLSEIATPAEFDLYSLSLMLRLSFGITAWKEYGPDRWALRANPSSGNLHPTETYLLMPTNFLLHEGQAGTGLYHYDAETHELSLRATEIELPKINSGFFLALSSVHWRESWKYGERAYRYCQLDIGHAIGALVTIVRKLGWRISWVKNIPDYKLSALLGLDREDYLNREKEHPGCLFYIGDEVGEAALDTFQLESFQAGENFFGTPSSLKGESPYNWQVVDDIAIVCAHEKEGIETVEEEVKNKICVENITAVGAFSRNQNQAYSNSTLESFLVKRRSAQIFQPSQIPKSAFVNMVSYFQQVQANTMLDGLAPLQMVVIVHRVEGIPSGIYLHHVEDDRAHFYKRDQNTKRNLARVLKDSVPVQFHIKSKTLKLVEIRKGNFQKIAASLCCHQSIASDCSFTLGFLAEFDHDLDTGGSQAYRYMHWQAGILAHAAYLQATSNTIAATGIGCFFDDAWHKLLGIETTSLQILYATAVGLPYIDRRVTTLPAYPEQSGWDAKIQQARS